MNQIANKSCVVAGHSALLVAATVGKPDALVISAACGVADVGAVALVALFVPGTLLGAIAVLPHARSS